MNGAHVLHVFRKDGLEILRDRRTIFVNVVLPILLYPLLLLFFVQVVQLTNKQKTEAPGVILVDVPEAIADRLSAAPAGPLRAPGGHAASPPAASPFEEGRLDAVRIISAADDPLLAATLREQAALLLRLHQSLETLHHSDGDDAPAGGAHGGEEQLEGQWRDACNRMLAMLRRQGAIAALVRMPDRDGQQHYCVIQDEASRRWDAVDGIINEVLDDYRTALVVSRLRVAHLPESTLHPLQVTSLPIASIAATLRTRLGGLLPLLLVVLSASGAFFPALDLICGERERGTLETLLSWPVTRRDLFLGKLLVACTAAAISVALHMTSLGVSLAIAGHQINHLGGDLGGLYAVGLGTLLLCGLVMLPLIITLAAVALAVTGLASTSKEAQNYLTPFTLVVLMAAMVGLIPSTRPGLVLDLLPIVGPVLTLKESMQGDHLPWIDLAVTWVASMSLAWVVIGWSTRLLEDERFRYPGLVRAGWGRFRRWGVGPAVPGGLEAIGVFAIAAGGFTMLSGYAAVNAVALVCIPLIAFAAGPALLHCFLGAYDPRLTLSLQRCSGRSLGLAVVLIPCAVALSIAVMLVQSHFMHGAEPSSESKIEEIAEQLRALGGLPLMVASMAVLPGICEELLFRGTVLSGLRRGIGPVGGILVSSFLFAALHADPERFVPQFFLGIVLAVLTVRAASIYPAMLVHAGHNSTVLIIDQFGNQLQRFAVVRMLEAAPLLVALVPLGVVGIVLCLAAVRPHRATLGAPGAPRGI